MVRRRRDRLEIPHFTDQDHVRVLAQHVLERRRERGGVGVDLALVHDALLVVVHVLDRILDRDDVAGARGVDEVDHGGERRRLAAPGRARDEDHALLLLGQVPDRLGEPELLAAEDLVGDLPDRHGRDAALQEDVGAEARESRDAEGEIELLGRLEALPLLLGQHAVRELLGHLRRERRVAHGRDRARRSGPGAARRPRCEDRTRAS
jgi:hypothetical protein